MYIIDVFDTEEYTVYNYRGIDLINLYFVPN